MNSDCHQTITLAQQFWQHPTGKPHEHDHMPQVDICENLHRLRENLHQCEQRAARPPASTKLIAVSKTKPLAMVQRALECGQSDFGESYAQEFEHKAQSLAEAPITWHFIGPIQSNKTRIIATWADWVHSIDRLKLARRLSAQRDPNAPPLNVCIQVNIDHEPSKAGVELNEVTHLAREIAAMDQLRLRGLMCLPRPRKDPQAQREPFERLRQALDQLNAQGFQLDTLSMGMSRDYCAAILEGATVVRIGTAIFGARQ